MVTLCCVLSVKIKYQSFCLVKIVNKKYVVKYHVRIIQDTVEPVEMAPLVGKGVVVYSGIVASRYIKFLYSIWRPPNYGDTLHRFEL